MLSLCKELGNRLPGLNLAVFCNTNFTWVERTDKIVQILKTWFIKFIYTAVTYFQ